MAEEDTLLSALAGLGFSAYEAKAYRALLQRGLPLSGYEVARSAGIPTSKIYETLARLAEKGAAVATDTDPVLYAAVPHPDVIARFRQRMVDAADAAEEQLARLPPGHAPELTVMTNGAANVREMMRRLIGRAQLRIFAALWDKDMDELAGDLERTHARGVELQIATYGRHRLSVPTTYDLTACGESAEDRLSGRRLSILVRDDAEALASEDYPGGAQAIWSSNRVFALLCVEYAKSDIMGRCLIESMGEDRYRRLRQENAGLRAMLRREPPP